MTRYYVEHKDGPRAAFKRLRYGHKMHATESDAWAQVASFDEDGLINDRAYRVVPVTD